MNKKGVNYMDVNCFFSGKYNLNFCKALSKPYSSCKECPFKKTDKQMSVLIKKYGYTKGS